MGEKYNYTKGRGEILNKGEKRKEKVYAELLEELLGKEGWEQVSEFKDGDQKVYGYEKCEESKDRETIFCKFLKKEKGIGSVQEVKRVYLSNKKEVKLLTDIGSFKLDLESVVTYYSKNVIDLL